MKMVKMIYHFFFTSNPSGMILLMFRIPGISTNQNFRSIPYLLGGAFWDDPPGQDHQRSTLMDPTMVNILGLSMVNTGESPKTLWKLSTVCELENDPVDL